MKVRRGRMKCCLNVIARWLSANLLLVLGYIALTRHAASRVEILAECKSGITMNLLFHDAEQGWKDATSDYGAYGQLKGGAMDMHAWIDGDRNVSDMGFELVSSAPSVRITSIKCRSRLLFLRTLDLDRVVVSSDKAGLSGLAHGCKDPLPLGPDGRLYLYPDTDDGFVWRWLPSWDQDRMLAISLLAVEMFLLLLSILFAIYSEDKMRWRKAIWQSAAVALFLSAFYELALPFQSYLVNESDFAFSAMHLLKDGIAGFWGVFLCAAGALFAISFFWGRFFHVVITAFLVYEYLETGVLSIGQPPLSGEVDYFLDRGKGLRDALIMAAILMAGAFSWTKLRNVVHWVAIGFLVMTCVSFFDVHPDRREMSSIEGPVSGLLLKKEVVENATYSTNRNVMVFVLDKMTSEVAEDVMMSDDDLRGKFNGFIGYRNNVGMHQFTDLGTAGLMTGMYLQSPGSLPAYVNSLWGQESVVVPYLGANASVYVCPGGRHQGCSNRIIKSSSSEERNSFSGETLSWRMSGQLKWSLREIVLFRCLPFIAKAVGFRWIVSAWPNIRSGEEESWVYPILAGRPVDENAALSFHYYHTQGSHEPLIFDRDGNVSSTPRYDYEAHREQAWYALRCLGRLFDAYRSKGIYDRSTIVVCSDHGGSYKNGGSYIKNGMTSSGLPMLWMKTEGDIGDFEWSEVPTSHAGIADMVKKSADKALSRKEAEEVLRSEDRLYRESCDGGFLDWHVDAVGHVRREMTQINEELAAVEIGKKYRSKDMLGTFGFCGVDWTSKQFAGNTPKMTISFKVVDSGSPCSVEMELSTFLSQTGGRKPYTASDPCLIISGEGIEKKRIFQNGEERAAVVLKGLRPNANGVVEVDIERHGFNDTVFLNNIKVEQ
ncbi:MAG: hypothetical protein IJG84_20390 [Kiritimatiellae bacterium]|nr:hypothetical protein [Kiritimatiellia bacterium]